MGFFTKAATFTREMLSYFDFSIHNFSWKAGMSILGSLNALLYIEISITININN